MRKQQWLYSLSMATSIALMLVPTHRALAQRADISVEIIEGARTARVGDTIVYTVEVTNHGPTESGFFNLFATTTPQLQITASSCGETTSPASCRYWGIPPGLTLRATFEAAVIESTSSRRATFSVEAYTFSGIDPERSNNTASFTTRIDVPSR